MIYLSLLKIPELEDLGLSKVGIYKKNLRKYNFTETDKKMEDTSYSNVRDMLH